MIPNDPSWVHVDRGGGLRVTAAGSVVVSTDGLLALAERLHLLAEGLRVDEGRVRSADAAAEGLPLPNDLAPRLQTLTRRCVDARDAVTQVDEVYTAHERAVEAAQRELAGLLAALAGPALLRLLTGLVITQPGLLLAVALVGWSAIPDGPDGKLGTVRDFFREHPELVTSPEFVRFVSLVATSVDDAALVTAGLPAWLVPLLPQGRDSGLAAGGRTLIGAGGLVGMLRETPVTVTPVGEPRPVPLAPVGVEDRLGRIPEGGQIRIERYEADGMPPRWVVYVPPTESFSPFATDEASDMTANMHGVAGLDAGSLRAVEQAMRDAGIAPTDEVALAGFSQGGMVVTRVAASGDWNVVALETHGAPAGNIPLPDGIAGLAIRNTDDFIPALAGPQLDHTLVQVEREAFAGEEKPPTVQVVPAHQRSAYESTARAVDTAESAVVREQIATFDAFTADYLDSPGGRATEFVFETERGRSKSGG